MYSTGIVGKTAILINGEGQVIKVRLDDLCTSLIFAVARVSHLQFPSKNPPCASFAQGPPTGAITAFDLTIQDNGKVRAALITDYVNIFINDDCLGALGRFSRELSCKMARKTAIAFSGDGRLLACGNSNGKIKIFCLADDDRQCDGLAGLDTIRDICFSHDDSLLAAFDRRGAMAVWDLRDTGRPRSMVRFRRLPRNYAPVCVTMVDDGRHGTVFVVAAISSRGTAAVFCFSTATGIATSKISLGNMGPRAGRIMPTKCPGHAALLLGGNKVVVVDVLTPRVVAHMTSNSWVESVSCSSGSSRHTLLIGNSSPSDVVEWKYL